MTEATKVILKWKMPVIKVEGQKLYIQDLILVAEPEDIDHLIPGDMISLTAEIPVPPEKEQA